MCIDFFEFIYFLLPGGNWCWRPRCERWKRRSRAQSKTQWLCYWFVNFSPKIYELRIVYFCSSCVCHVLGRGGSSWIGWGERIICKYPVFPLFRSRQSLSTKDLNFLFKPKDDLFWAVKQRTQTKSYCYYRKAALHKVTVHFLDCKLFSQSVFGFSVHCS